MSGAILIRRGIAEGRKMIRTNLEVGNGSRRSRRSDGDKDLADVIYMAEYAIPRGG